MLLKDQELIITTPRKVLKDTFNHVINSVSNSGAIITFFSHYRNPVNFDVIDYNDEKILFVSIIKSLRKNQNVLVSCIKDYSCDIIFSLIKSSNRDCINDVNECDGQISIHDYDFSRSQSGGYLFNKNEYLDRNFYLIEDLNLNVSAILGANFFLDLNDNNKNHCNINFSFIHGKFDLYQSIATRSQKDDEGDIFKNLSPLKNFSKDFPCSKFPKINIQNLSFYADNTGARKDEYDGFSEVVLTTKTFLDLEKNQYFLLYSYTHSFNLKTSNEK